MSAGTLLSESSAEGYATGRDALTLNDFIAALIMFVSYFLSGFLALFPYLLWPVETALKISIFVSVAALFSLGITSATLSGTHLLKSGIRMVIIGGLAIVVGAFAGSLVPMIH